jgi:hypothetical protein
VEHNQLGVVCARHGISQVGNIIGVPPVTHGDQDPLDHFGPFLSRIARPEAPTSRLDRLPATPLLLLTSS